MFFEIAHGFGSQFLEGNRVEPWDALVGIWVMQKRQVEPRSVSFWWGVIFVPSFWIGRIGRGVFWAKTCLWSRRSRRVSVPCWDFWFFPSHLNRYTNTKRRVLFNRRGIDRSLVGNVTTWQEDGTVTRTRVVATSAKLNVCLTRTPRFRPQPFPLSKHFTKRPSGY